MFEIAETPQKKHILIKMDVEAATTFTIYEMLIFLIHM